MYFKWALALRSGSCGEGSGGRWHPRAKAQGLGLRPAARLLGESLKMRAAAPEKPEDARPGCGAPRSLAGSAAKSAAKRLQKCSAYA